MFLEDETFLAALKVMLKAWLKESKAAEMVLLGKDSFMPYWEDVNLVYENTEAGQFIRQVWAKLWADHATQECYEVAKADLHPDPGRELLRQKVRRRVEREAEDAMM